MDIMPLFAQYLKPQTNVWDAISDLPEIEPGNGDGLFNYPTNSKVIIKQYFEQVLTILKTTFVQILVKLI